MQRPDVISAWFDDLKNIEVEDKATENLPDCHQLPSLST
jgi:hypothetical protein